MKIKSIEFHDSPVLGDFRIDFTDTSGQPVDTIILAGENGCGKSSILQAVYEMSRLDVINVPSSKEVRTFAVELSADELGVLKDHVRTKEHFGDIKGSDLRITYDLSLHRIHDQVVFEATSQSGAPISVQGSVLAHPDIRAKLRSLFSDAEISFTPNKIQSVTTQGIDRVSNTSIKSTFDLATGIAQLIVDVQALDNDNFTRWGEENIDQPVDGSRINTRISRFKEAFSFMFPTKRYMRVETEGNVKKVMFEDRGAEMPLDSLSSGEKQIVFRGTFLLRDQKHNSGALVLIDEPEISLHPKWQLRILEFYKRLFQDERGCQTSQIIVATHSPFIIHNDSRAQDKVIVLKRTSTGQIEIAQNPTFKAWTGDTAVQEAFDIPRFLGKHTKPLVLTEGETDVRYISAALSHLGRRELLGQLDIDWVGNKTAEGGAMHAGSSALDHVWKALSANPRLLRHKLLLLYDSDANKPDADNGQLSVRGIPRNPDNVKITAGIENLFPTEVFEDSFYRTKTKTGKYGEETTWHEFQKAEFATWICDERQNPSDFAGFSVVVDILDGFLSG